MKNTLTLIIALLTFVSKGQMLSIEEIETEASSIDNNDVLKHWNSEWFNLENEKDTIVYWGFLNIWFENNQIRKIVQLNNYSYGSEEITMYLKNGEPVKIIESEKNDSKKVFTAILFIENWNDHKYMINQEGKRNYSKEDYTSKKYNSILELASSDLKNAINQEKIINNLKK